MIDLRSDTLTMPTPGMLRAMVEAQVGDDNFGEDPATNALEEYCAGLFGKEAAVFTPTGTMSNQLALRVHTRPGDEVIIDESYHFNIYESAPSADLAGVSLHTVRSADGILTPGLIDTAIDARCRDPRYSPPRLVAVENTINYRSGRVVSLRVLRTLRAHTARRGLRTHLDGARLFNAVVATRTTPEQHAELVDTLSVCFAKGLGAPFGSILAGPADLIAEARYYRKSYGGAMHQCGNLAAAARYALLHHVERLEEDHATARALADQLTGHPLIQFDPAEVQSNIVIVDISATGAPAERIADATREAGLLVVPISQRLIRFVTRMGISEPDVVTAADIFRSVLERLVTRPVAAAGHGGGPPAD
jgi:threonine aldolase